MTRIECSREQDVLDVVASRRWPLRCDAELRDHVAACPVCADLVEVAAALLDPVAPLDETREMPSASLVWWRAQLRAREDAARLARRPLGAARVLAAACAALLAIVVLQAILPSAWTWVSVGLAWRPALEPEAATAVIVAVLANRAVHFAALASLVFGPVAVYLAFGRD